MPHISNRKIDDKSFNKIYDQLISVFDTSAKSLSSDVLLDEFLTKTEKIMFAKRLAILGMIDEGVSKYYIADILTVSSSTVDRLALKYEIGKFPHLLKIIKKNKETIWQSLGGFIDDSVSKQIGKKRWDWLNEIDKKYNRKRLKI